jgi:hypothetical protein
LPIVNSGGGTAPQQQPAWQSAPAPQQAEWQPQQQQPTYQQPPPAPRFSGNGQPSHDEVLSALERLGALHQKGILSDQEFASKKAELLSRL